MISEPSRLQVAPVFRRWPRRACTDNEEDEDRGVSARGAHHTGYGPGQQDGNAGILVQHHEQTKHLEKSLNLQNGTTGGLKKSPAAYTYPRVYNATVRLESTRRRTMG